MQQAHHPAESSSFHLSISPRKIAGVVAAGFPPEATGGGRSSWIARRIPFRLKLEPECEFVLTAPSRRGEHNAAISLRPTGVAAASHQSCLSVNQLWPGYVGGEWHNNHHLYPHGARSGFLPYQLDLAWEFIRGMSRLGVVSSYRDPRADFLRDHYEPYVRANGASRTRPSAQ